jgi:hypothetical protein
MNVRAFVDADAPAVAALISAGWWWMSSTTGSTRR